MQSVILSDAARIGNLTWIFALPLKKPPLGDAGDRKVELVLEKGASITSRHLLDCSEQIWIGAHALVAGYGSQLITHAVCTQRNSGLGLFLSVAIA